MANQEHLAWLKRGVEQWNEWREQHPGAWPGPRGADLSGAHLTGSNLSGAHLRFANLSHADLRFTDLSGANLSYANLSAANLLKADLIGADLIGANLSRVNLSSADLSSANLNDADLYGANLANASLLKANLVRSDLSSANLSHAHLDNALLDNALLDGTNLSDADLSGANLCRARMVRTILARVDLRKAKGLIEIYHQGPSSVELCTVQLPQDGSALRFLRGAGVPDEWIDFWRTAMIHPIQYHSCFISYASRDDRLARRLHADLQDQGVRCWFAPEDMKIGDKIRARIEEAIHLQDKLLLLLSEHAITSSWVEDEVEAALEKEQRQQREVLFPVRLDESVMQTNSAWAAKLRRTRHIGDFTAWTDPLMYQTAFERLLRDLKHAAP